MQHACMGLPAPQGTQLLLVHGLGLLDVASEEHVSSRTFA